MSNSFLRVVLTLITAATFLASLSVARVDATPIAFTFTGTGTGVLGATPFTRVPFIITAIADTLNIVTSSTSDGATNGALSLDTDLATITIAGIGTVTFTLGTRVFDARGVTVNSQGPLDLLGFARAGLNGILLMDFANSAFATYDLATAFGPLFVGNAISLNSIPTTMGNLTFDTVADVTFTAATGAQADSYTFAVIDVPDAYSTVAFGINARGEIVGGYTDFAGRNHGFLLSGGSFTAINGPGATSTTAFGINARGQIVGYYTDATGDHGFLLSKGSFTTIDFPGGSGTQAFGINARGEIVGRYTDATGDHGFLLSRGSFTAINVPEARFTQSWGINNSDDIVGYYTDATGDHGFLLSEGSFTTIDFPGGVGTTVRGINDRGQIVGAIGGDGFLLSGGSFTVIGVPGPGGTFPTVPVGINARGQIVGYYTDATTGRQHGFLAVPVL